MSSLPTVSEISAHPMAPTDLPEVMEIEAYSFNSAWRPEMFMGEMANKSARPIVFRRSNKLVGYVCVWFIADEAHLHNIAVHPDLRRQGLGAWFMDYVEKLAGENNMQRIALDVARDNKGARRLYLKSGFTTVGFRRKYYADTGQDALIMEKLLSS
jgi:ribosomal-protein-alanine N-acetyltransferase